MWLFKFLEYVEKWPLASSAGPRRRGRRVDPVPVRPLGVRSKLLPRQGGRKGAGRRRAQDISSCSHQGTKVFFVIDHV